MLIFINIIFSNLPKIAIKSILTIKKYLNRLFWAFLKNIFLGPLTFWGPNNISDRGFNKTWGPNKVSDRGLDKIWGPNNISSRGLNKFRAPIKFEKKAGAPIKFGAPITTSIATFHDHFQAYSM